MPRPFVILLSLIALGAAMLIPLRVQAAILQACENEPVSSMVPAAGEPLCALAKAVDDAAAETSEAPICDPRGASAVAPRRILPIDDARIDIEKPCGAPALSPALSTGHDNPPGSWTVLGPQQALAAESCGIDGRVYEIGSDFLPVRGAARPGVMPGVYHPPR